MEGTIRLNKYLSDAGVCSRREADRLVEEGKVLVDGEIAVMGMQIRPGQKVVCDGKPVGEKEKPVFLIVNKPRGIVCTTSDKDHAENIVEFLNYPQRIYPVGRLDKDSEGLLLMTNQGDIVNKILRGGNAHEKEYAVAVNHPVTEEFLNQMCEGVRIEDLDVTTKPCRAWKTGSHTFHIVLTQYEFATFSTEPTIPQAYTKSKCLCICFCIFMQYLSFYNLYAYHFSLSYLPPVMQITTK